MNHFDPHKAEVARQSPVILALAILYQRHNDPARALALGLAAMRAGPVTPAAVLLVASCFLKTGDAEQALAALSRFEGPGALMLGTLTNEERAAAALLKAKALFRTGDHDTARKALSEASEFAAKDAAAQATS